MMQYLKRAALGLAVASLLVGTCAKAWDIGDMNRTIEQTNVLVNDGCSGTIIDVSERLILTANHCVADQYETIERDKIAEDGVITKEKVRVLRDGTVSQLTFDGAQRVITTTYAVRVKAVDATLDLALLQVVAALKTSEAAPIACDMPRRGEQVYVVGNPMGILYASVVSGIVSSMQRTYSGLGISSEKTALMQVSGGVIGGNSGGAVYNTSGKFVGVPVLASPRHAVLGFATPLDDVQAFLKRNAPATLKHCA